VIALRHGPVVLAVLATTLAGCASGPLASPSPIGAQPTYSCTPEAGGASQPCYEYEYQTSQAREKLYAEAEAVYRKRLIEDERIYRAGGVTEATPVMLETTMGEALDDMLANYRRIHKEKLKARGGQFTLGYVKRVPDVIKGASVVTLETCVDASSVNMVEPTSTDTGTTTAERAYFSRDGAALKVSYLEHKDVASCS
jgi:hypothetical protein